MMRRLVGTILGQQGEYQAALHRYTQAVDVGSFVAELNKAHILELEGYEEESRARYDDALSHVSESGLPEYHM